jgi:hypothetical protein
MPGRLWRDSSAKPAVPKASIVASTVGEGLSDPPGAGEEPEQRDAIEAAREGAADQDRAATV